MPVWLIVLLSVGGGILFFVGLIVCGVIAANHEKAEEEKKKARLEEWTVTRLNKEEVREALAAALNVKVSQVRFWCKNNDIVCVRVMKTGWDG